MTSVILIALLIFLYSLQTLFCTMYINQYKGKSVNASPVISITILSV